MIKATSVKGMPAFEIGGNYLMVEQAALETALNGQYQRGYDAALDEGQPRRMLSARQIAEALAMSDSKARRLLNDGIIPSFRLDNSVRCWLEDFEVYVAGQVAAGEIVPGEYEAFMQKMRRETAKNGC